MGKGPKNEVTGVEYTGGNIARLEAAAESAGYSDKGWAGFKQWLTAGRVVTKGQQGTKCVRVNIVKDKKTGEDKKVPSGFTVFHFDQTEVLVPKADKADVAALTVAEQLGVAA